MLSSTRRFSFRPAGTPELIGRSSHDVPNDDSASQMIDDRLRELGDWR